MTKWISIQDAANKFGTTEEIICSMIRHRYITFSFVDDSSLGGNYRDKLLMISADDLEEALELNVVASLKQDDDKSIVRIPFRELNDILQANDHLIEVNKSLLHQIKTMKEREKEQNSLTITLIQCRSRKTLHSVIIQKIKYLIRMLLSAH